MQNLDQIRAAAALQAAGSTTRQAVSKLPAMILQNGFLAAAAFACEEKERKFKRPDMESAFKATAKHLVDRGIAEAGDGSIPALIRYLSGKDPLVLQRATAEALAFLAFLKRFATKEETAQP